MAKGRPQRRMAAVGISAALMGVFVLAVALMASSHAADPTYQQRITMPGVSGIEDYLINLWVDPKPAAVGRTTLTVQVTSSIGTPTHTNRVSLQLTRPDGSTSEPVDATPLPAGSDPQGGWETTVDFDQAGPWQVVVQTVALGNVERTVTFHVDVQS